VQVPNRPKSKDNDNTEGKGVRFEVKDDAGTSQNGDNDSKRSPASSARSPAHANKNWTATDGHDPDDPASEPLLGSAVNDASSRPQVESLSDGRSIKQPPDAAKARESRLRQREELEAMIEKKTYIGLVCLTHSLD